jgi:hypothetical protein
MGILECAPLFFAQGRKRGDLVTRRIMVAIRAELLMKEFHPEGYQRKTRVNWEEPTRGG